MSYNPQKPATNPNKPGTPAATPQGGTPPEMKSGPEKCTIIWKSGAWTMATYENTTDGTNGFILSNGQTAMHFDSAGNMIMSTGKPLGGCGGKAIIVANDSQQKYKSVAIEVQGNDDEATTQQNSSTGNTEVAKTPAYSITVYGDVAIESIGGDIGLKGDNISLNAASTLTLKSGENINIEAGNDSGNVNIFSGNVNLDAMFFNKNIGGGEYSEGAGEFKVEQKNPGAVTEISTPGSVRYIVNGNYEIGVTGDLAINAERSVAISAKKDYFTTVQGNSDTQIGGKNKLAVFGNSTVSQTKQKENYLIEVGAGDKSMKVSTASDLELSSTKKVLVNSVTDVEIKATGLVRVEGTSIYLN